MTPDTGGRRPLASRDTRWAKGLAARLARSGVAPNAISAAGFGFAALAGLSFVQWDSGGSAVWLVAAAAGCQLRLVCNLVDGLVAVEGGRGAADGAFWNEVPDRASDIAILAGMGIAAGVPALGWAAAAMAVLTAYLREFGRASGLRADYGGPMAKPQRMAVATGAALLTLAEPLWSGQGEVLRWALWIIALGAGATALRRALRIVAGLRAVNRNGK